MGAGILNSQGDVAACAEANMCAIALVRMRTLRRRRLEPFMSYNYEALTGEDLLVPISAR